MEPRMLLSLVAVLGGCATAEQPTPSTGAPPAAATLSLSIESTGEGDSVLASVATPSELVLDVRSERGIGGAKLTLGAGPWPERMVLRLHLSGLESLRIESGERGLGIAMQSHGDHQILQVYLPGGGGAQRELEAGNPHWASVEVSDGSQAVATPVLPLEAGYFEVTLPPAFLEEASDTLAISWIDFYR